MRAIVVRKRQHKLVLREFLRGNIDNNLHHRDKSSFVCNDCAAIDVRPEAPPRERTWAPVGEGSKRFLGGRERPWAPAL